jgi:hypothetical protein
VGAHMLGAGLVWVAVLRLWWLVRPASAAILPFPRLSATRSLEDNLTVANAAGVRESS